MLHALQPPILRETMTDNAQNSTSQWLKLSFLCPLPLLEPASDLLGILSGSGVEQSPETDEGATISGFFQLGTNDNGEEVSVESVMSEVQPQLSELFALYAAPLPAFTTALMADEDWATSWQQYFKPFEIVPGLIIKPSWEEFTPADNQQVIEMDPGMAFGTGQHASTQMALALIQDSMSQIQASSAFDVGTGTGILAMASLLFGARHALAIDNDPEAVRVALENIAHNGLAERIAVRTTPVEEVTETFPLVIANIVHDVLIAMAPTLVQRTAQGGHLVLAGILSGIQEENIIQKYEELGCRILNRKYTDEWVSLQFDRR
nr:50S ribosomal protein L11 methyltransferase [uncultured Desulfobulbus sp.]